MMLLFLTLNNYCNKQNQVSNKYKSKYSWDIQLQKAMEHHNQVLLKIRIA